MVDPCCTAFVRYRFGRTEPALLQVRSSRFRPPQVRSGRFGPGSVGVPQVRSQPNLYSRRFGRNRTLYVARNLCGTQVRSRPNLCEHRFGRQPNPCLPRFGRRTEPVHEQVPSQPNPCLPRFGHTGCGMYYPVHCTGCGMYYNVLSGASRCPHPVRCTGCGMYYPVHCTGSGMHYPVHLGAHIRCTAPSRSYPAPSRAPGWVLFSISMWKSS